MGFWTAVLGYAPTAEGRAADRLGHGSTIWMQDLDPEKPLRHAMHVDVSVSRDHVEDRLEAALATGGRIVDDSEAPRWWTLSNRAGNRVCIAARPDGASKSDPDKTTEGREADPPTSRRSFHSEAGDLILVHPANPLGV